MNYTAFIVVIVLFLPTTTSGFIGRTAGCPMVTRFSCSAKGRRSSRNPLYYYFCDPTDDSNKKKKKKKDDSSSSSSSTGHDFEMDMEELERARAALEALMTASSSSESILSSSSSIESPALSTTRIQNDLLTSAGRRMRELEMQLLASLEGSDAAIDELVHLWSTERDETAAIDLIQMQSQCSKGLVEEEAKLHAMCHNFVGWAEPYARLTTLLYYLGRTEEAVSMAERAIALKPWHFEALQMCILIARHEQSDPDTVARAQYLARNAMPPLDEDPEGRRAWVSRALVWAKQQLADAEESTFRAQRYSNSLTEDDIWQ